MKILLQKIDQDNIFNLKKKEQMWNQTKPMFSIEMSQQDKEKINLIKSTMIEEINNDCQFYEKQMEEHRQQYQAYLSIQELGPQVIQKINEFIKFIDFQKSQIVGQYKSLENEINSAQLK